MLRILLLFPALHALCSAGIFQPRATTLNVNFDELVFLPVAGPSTVITSKGIRFIGFSPVGSTVSAVGLQQPSPPNNVAITSTSPTSSQITVKYAGSPYRIFTINSFYFGATVASGTADANIPVNATTTFTCSKAGAVDKSQSFRYTLGGQLRAPFQQFRPILLFNCETITVSVSTDIGDIAAALVGVLGITRAAANALATRALVAGAFDSLVIQAS